MAHVAGVVDALRSPLDCVEKLREGFPAPLDAGLHRLARDVLGAFEIAEHQSASSDLHGASVKPQLPITAVVIP